MFNCSPVTRIMNVFSINQMQYLWLVDFNSSVTLLNKLPNLKGRKKERQIVLSVSMAIHMKWYGKALRCISRAHAKKKKEKEIVASK